MSEYLDNIYTDNDLLSREFIDEINKDLSDITGYESAYESVRNIIDNNEVDIDPLDGVLNKEIVEIVETKFNIIDDLDNDKKRTILRRPRSISSISMDDNFNILCNSWGNYFIRGGRDAVETTGIINDYIEETKRPVTQRDLNRFIVGRKNVIEKFNDMNFYRGKLNINEFFDNVV